MRRVHVRRSACPHPSRPARAVKHNGNLTLDQILEVARQMRPRSLARQFSGTVKEILGTA